MDFKKINNYLRISVNTWPGYQRINALITIALVLVCSAVNTSLSAGLWWWRNTKTHWKNRVLLYPELYATSTPLTNMKELVKYIEKDL